MFSQEWATANSFSSPDAALGLWPGVAAQSYVWCSGCPGSLLWSAGRWAHRTGAGARLRGITRYHQTKSPLVARLTLNSNCSVSLSRRGPQTGSSSWARLGVQTGTAVGEGTRRHHALKGTCDSQGTGGEQRARPGMQATSATQAQDTGQRDLVPAPQLTACEL